MRVLITGAYGLIGAACLARLHAEGHEVVGAGRSIGEAQRRFPYARWIAADFNKLTAPGSWHGLLAGVDAVVNCVGALQDGARDDLNRVHVTAPAALFTACEQKGVRRIVHISAVGAGADGATAFARTKGETERNLAGRNLDWFILRPGLVLAGAVYGGTAMLRGAAGFPWLTPVIAAKPIQVVALDDVAATVAWALREGTPARVTLDLVHPQALSLTKIVTAYRAWLGFRPQPAVTVPRAIATLVARMADAASWLGWRSPLRSTAIAQLGAGIGGDAAPWIAATGIVPQSLDGMLARTPATVQDRWFARLYWLKPVAIIVLAAFWIATGIITLGPGWTQALLVLRVAGADLATAKIAGFAGACLDIALGLAVLVRRFCRGALAAMLTVSAAYFVATAITSPQLFADPLGSIVKIVPIMLATAFTVAILDER